jgi:hypothetical protein
MQLKGLGPESLHSSNQVPYGPYGTQKRRRAITKPAVPYGPNASASEAEGFPATFRILYSPYRLESAVNGQPSPRLGGLRPWAAKYCKISQV